MKRLFTGSLLCLAFAGGNVSAAVEPTEKDAIAMAERGAVFMKAHGKEEMMKKITAKDPDFVQGSLYVDMRDIKTGIVLAHPINPSIVGKDLTDVPDANGNPCVFVAMINSAQSGNGRGRAVLDTLVDWVARSGAAPAPALGTP